MPEKNNDLSAVDQEFERLRAENQVPVKPAEGLTCKDSDLKLHSTTYGPDPKSPSDELMSALKNEFEPDSIFNSEPISPSPHREFGVIPKVDTKAGPGLEHLETALDKDVDPLSALNADEEK